MIERTRYLESLIARKHNGMVKVITGVRYGVGVTVCYYRLKD